MNRDLSLLLVLPLGLFAACASKSTDPSTGDKGSTPGAEQPGAPGAPGSPGAPGGPVATPDEKKKNPIEGIAAAKMTMDTGAATDGAIWSAKEGVLFFTTPLGEGGLIA